MKLVNLRTSVSGRGTPAASPAAMHCSSQSRLRASWRMVCRPSSSCATSSGRTVHHRPVLRGHDRHVRDHRVFDQLIERGRRARAPRRDDAGAGLVRPAVAGVEQSVAERRHRAGDSGIVHRGREHERIRRLHRVNGVVHQAAAHAVPGRIASTAGGAATGLLCANGQDLRLDPRRLKHLLHFVQGGVCAAARVRAAVDHENFHCITSSAG